MFAALGALSNRFAIEADAIVLDDEQQRVRIVAQRHADRRGLRVPQRIVHRLLDQAEHRHIHCRRDVDAAVRRIEFDAHTRAARQRLEMMVERGDQACLVEQRRPKSERDVARLADHAVDHVDRVLESLRDGGVGRDAAEHLQVDLGRGERLAELIVQFARNVAALLFLR